MQPGLLTKVKISIRILAALSNGAHDCLITYCPHKTSEDELTELIAWVDAYWGSPSERVVTGDRCGLEINLSGFSADHPLTWQSHSDRSHSPPPA